MESSVIKSSPMVAPLMHNKMRHFRTPEDDVEENDDHYTTGCYVMQENGRGTEEALLLVLRYLRNH